MAKITDPDDLIRASSPLNVGVDGNIYINTSALTIDIQTFSGLTTDGVSLQTVYSYLKEEWKNDPELIKFDFPMVSITNEQFELFNGWDFANSGTKLLIRDGGWALTSGGTSIEEYMNLTTLGSFEDAGADQAYFQQGVGLVPTSVALTGEVNQAIQIYSSPSLDNFDYRNFFKIFLREQGKIYDSYDLLTEQNLTELTYRKYALPLSNSLDLKILATDAEIATGATWSGMSITYTTGFTRTIGASSYTFSVLIDGDNKTAEEIYEFVQYQLRQSGDIDSGAGVISGQTADELLVFVGDTLLTQLTSEGGVYIDNFQVADTNRLTFTDDSGIERTFPFVAAGSINFNDNLQDSTDAKFWMFFTNANGNRYGQASAIIVQDNSGSDITGLISGQTSYSFDFDYDNNVQGGRTPETDAGVTIVAVGTDTAQYVKAFGTITRSTQNNFSLVSALERNYLNP